MSAEDRMAAAEQVLASRDAPLEEGTSAPEPDVQSDEESFTNFRLEDVPEEYREHVKKAYDQMRSDYSRKTGELAETRKSLGTLAERREEAENALGFISALNSEEQQQVALKQLIDHVGEDTVLNLLGIEVEDNDESAGDEDDDDQFRDPRVDQLLEERQAEQAQREEAEEAARLEQVATSIREDITEQAKKASLDLDDDDHEDLFWKVIDLGADDQGRPRVQDALNWHSGKRDKIIKSYRDSRKANVSSAPASGSSPSPSHDRSDPKARRENALAILNRTLG